MQLYDLTVTALSGSKAQLMVARLMASRASVPLHEAMEIVKHPPVRIFTGLNTREAEQLAGTLSRFGVQFSYSLSKKQPEHQSPPIITSPAPDQKSNSVGETPARRTTSGGPDDLSEILSQNHTPPKPKPAIFSSPEKKAAPQSTSQFRFRLMPPTQGPDRKKVLIVQGVIVVVLLAFVVLGLMNFTEKESRFRVAKTRPPVAISSGAGAQNSSAQRAAKSGSGQQRQQGASRQISHADASKAQSLVDSAEAVSSDYLRAINFYKVAISFNEYNLNAWQGLTETYRSAGMIKEMHQAQKRMNDLFGQSISSVSSLIKRYGELTDAWLTESGTYRVEYRSRSVGKDNLLQETFTLTQGLRNICNCESISLFASSGPGRGMIVHTRLSSPLSSLREFKKHATITFLD